MTMDVQTLINISAGAVLAAVGWFARQLYYAVENLRKSVHDIEIDLPKNYIQKKEFTEEMRDIKQMLSKIFDKLDGKADK